MSAEHNCDSPVMPEGSDAQSEAGLPCLPAGLQRLDESHIDTIANLVSRAMNLDEGRQARATLEFHFACRRHGIDDGRQYYILELNGVVVGIGGLHHYAWGPSPNVWLAWFAVDPQFHGQGLGAYLLDAVTQKAKELGFMKFFIETYSTPEFARARRFYQAQGFHLVGHVQAYLPDGGDMVVYCKDLTTHV